LPKASRKRLAVEMASPMGWHKYTTDEGDMLCMTTFGESAPAEDLYKHFGFTVDNVVKKAKALLIDMKVRLDQETRFGFFFLLHTFYLTIIK
jgi:transketolase